MFHFIFFILLYFLPSIIGRDKKDATGIFLVNFFLGWTLIGWVVALLWACASDRQPHLQYAAAGGGRFCSHCGSAAVSAGLYCSSCGARV
jgi:hypothetical protein